MVAYPGPPGPVAGVSTIWIGTWAVVERLIPSGSWASGPVPVKVAWLVIGSTAGGVGGASATT